jgi:WD40-like Beta Propeller Repeat
MERTARQSRRAVSRVRLEPIEDRNLPSPPYGPWGAPVNLGPVVNTAFSDQHPAISKDGLSLYITSDRPGGYGKLDLWVSHRDSADSPWQTPVNLGPTINTGGDDRVPTFSRDGHWMIFGSINRPGGFGATDLWASYRQDVHDDFAWQTPVNLGPTINTSTDEDGATLFRDDETGVVTLYFTSLNRAAYPGTDWDIYASTLQPDGSFSPAVPVSPLNVPGGATNARDTRTAIRHDGRELFVTTNRPGGQGLIDLWVSTRDTTADPWSVPVNLGSVVNGTANDGAPTLSSDGTELYFYSNRAGSIPDANGVPTNDLYVVTRTKLNTANGLGGTDPSVGSDSGFDTPTVPSAPVGEFLPAVTETIPAERSEGTEMVEDATDPAPGTGPGPDATAEPIAGAGDNLDDLGVSLEGFTLLADIDPWAD